MELTITAAHLDAARRAGACSSRLCRYRPGMPVAELAWDDALWVERHLPDVAAAIRQQTGLPLWALLGAGYGYGYWSEDGYGYWDVYGSGYGYGYGYGDGDGDGSGAGAPNGEGAETQQR